MVMTKMYLRLIRMFVQKTKTKTKKAVNKDLRMDHTVRCKFPKTTQEQGQVYEHVMHL